MVLRLWRRRLARRMLGSLLVNNARWSRMLEVLRQRWTLLSVVGMMLWERRPVSVSCPQKTMQIKQNKSGPDASGCTRRRWKSQQLAIPCSAFDQVC